MAPFPASDSDEEEDFTLAVASLLERGLRALDAPPVRRIVLVQFIEFDPIVRGALQAGDILFALQRIDTDLRSRAQRAG